MKKYIANNSGIEYEAEIYSEQSDELLDTYYWYTSDLEYVLDSSIERAEEEFEIFDIKVIILDSYGEEVASYIDGDKQYYEKSY